MLDHLEIQTDQIDKTQHFYAAVLAPLGYEMMRAGKGVGFGEGGRLDFFIVRGAPSANVHFAFEAPSRRMVDKIYALARDAGFALDRAPALAAERT